MSSKLVLIKSTPSLQPHPKFEFPRSQNYSEYPDIAMSDPTSFKDEPPDPADVKKLTDYFSWRQPYRGDEVRATEDITWALRQAKKPPADLAILILSSANEINSLLNRIKAISVVSSNPDFIHDATLESVEWAFGQKLKKNSPTPR